MNSKNVLQFFIRNPKWFAVLLAIIILTTAFYYHLNSPKLSYYVDTKILLEKDLDNQSENSQILIKVFKQEAGSEDFDRISCDPKNAFSELNLYGKCTKIFIEKDGVEREATFTDYDGYNEFLLRNIEEGDYSISIDIEDDGKIDGTMELPIKRRIKVTSPKLRERIPGFEFTLRWDEDQKEVWDEIIGKVSNNFERYNIWTDNEYGNGRVGGGIYALSKPIQNIIISEIKIRKDDFLEGYETGLFRLIFDSNYHPVEGSDQGRVKFSPPLITERTTFKIILGNYTKYGGEPSKKDWEN